MSPYSSLLTSYTDCSFILLIMLEIERFSQEYFILKNIRVCALADPSEKVYQCVLLSMESINVLSWLK